jgi:hypothetical protein
MSLYICKNPNHIHSTLIPPTEHCRHYVFNNFVAYSPRPITINFNKFKFEKKEIKKINEEKIEENIEDNIADNIADNIEDNIADNIADNIEDNIADNL